MARAPSDDKRRASWMMNKSFSRLMTRGMFRKENLRLASYLRKRRIKANKVDTIKLVGVLSCAARGGKLQVSSKSRLQFHESFASVLCRAWRTANKHKKKALQESLIHKSSSGSFCFICKFSSKRLDSSQGEKNKFFINLHNRETFFQHCLAWLMMSRWRQSAELPCSCSECRVERGIWQKFY